MTLFNFTDFYLEKEFNVILTCVLSRLWTMYEQDIS